jgi:sulfoxide reductase heme-binding subunit YedZ
MARVKYRGLSPHTQPLRWVLFALAIGGVIVGTAPGVAGVAWDWLGTHQESLAWYGSRLLGFLAYGALTLSVVYGLLLSSGILDAVAHRGISLTLHQELSALAIGLTALHGALLALDTFVPQTVRQLVVPFTGPYRTEWVGIGQLAFYLMLTVYGSFYVKRHIGQRGWRLLHYTTLLAFGGATIHGLMTGSDTSTPWAMWGYLGAVVAVSFLLLYRITIALFQPPTTARVPVFERSELP